MATTPGTARMRLTQAMNSGLFSGPVPSADLQARRQWTNTYKSLNAQRGPNQSVRQMMYQGAMKPTGSRPIKNPNANPLDDPRGYLIQMYLRSKTGMPGVYYGRTK